MRQAEKFGQEQLPPFYKRQASWLEKEYAFYRNKGVPNRLMTTSKDILGTLYFKVSGKEVSRYEIDY